MFFSFSFFSSSSSSFGGHSAITQRSLDVALTATCGPEHPETNVECETDGACHQCEEQARHDGKYVKEQREAGRGGEGIEDDPTADEKVEGWSIEEGPDRGKEGGALALVIRTFSFVHILVHTPSYE